MRITRKHLEAKVSIINDLLGYDDPQWNTGGAVQLYGAYGGYSVRRIVNMSGYQDSLMHGVGTARETSDFLSGMIAALRIARESVVS